MKPKILLCLALVLSGFFNSAQGAGLCGAPQERETKIKALLKANQ
jgi:hypothetical protein